LKLSVQITIPVSKHSASSFFVGAPFNSFVKLKIISVNGGEQKTLAETPATKKDLSEVFQKYT